MKNEREPHTSVITYLSVIFLLGFVLLLIFWAKESWSQTPLNMGYPTDNGTMNIMMEKWCDTKLRMIIDLQMITSRMPNWEKYRFSRSATTQLQKLSDMRFDEDWLNNVVCSAPQYPYY